MGHSSWADESYSELLSDLWVDLRILVLGPGETSKPEWQDKRREIITSLKTASEDRDDVKTCEELFREHPPVVIEHGYAELAHVDKEDIIIALIVASPSEQGGVYRELEIIAEYSKYRGKALIFLPNQRNYIYRFQAGMLQVYKEEQKIVMDWPTLMECQKLRRICIGKVEEERKQRMYNKYFARMKTRGN